MKEYQYVPLAVGGGFFIDNSDYQHRTIINDYAQQGWRYVGFVPSRFTGNGSIKEIDLIFEKDGN